MSEEQNSERDAELRALVASLLKEVAALKASSQEQVNLARAIIDVWMPLLTRLLKMVWEAIFQTLSRQVRL